MNALKSRSNYSKKHSTFLPSNVVLGLLCHRLLSFSLHFDGIDLVHDLHAAASWLLPHLCLVDLKGWVAEGTGMAVDAGRGPFHVAWIDGDVSHTVTMVFVFRFINELAGSNVVDVC